MTRPWRGLFVGLTTLDLVYRATHPPVANEKLVATDYRIAAGGPATNAAVTFQHLGGQATVLSALGQHPIAHLIQDDLTQYQVQQHDLDPDNTEPPPVSSIVVTASTGDRAVISINAVNRQIATFPDLEDLLEAVDVVLLDGHQMAVGAAIAQLAQNCGIPVVVDGGSWKPEFETVLAHTDYALCAATFQPPGTATAADCAAYLRAVGVPHVAITHGGQPIQYWTTQRQGELSVPAVAVVDTLGAGDVLHGAFCHAIAQRDFLPALAQAAQVASQSCQHFGPRAWMATSRGAPADPL